jgi:hypothetical protein
MLLDAHNYAEDLDCDAWDFAVELPSLRQLGLTNNDCRWLVGRGVVTYACETTLDGEPKRSFQYPKSLLFTNGTSFVLSDEGVDFARQALRDAEELGESQGLATARSDGLRLSTTNGVPNAVKPTWDPDRQQLRVGDRIVKEFKVPAPNQETILAAFEEEQWPPRIDDPLTPVAEQDPKRRLHDTINSLNRNQKRPLVRFFGDGSGQGVRWELTVEADSAEVA